jgi:hypothetical protein
MPPVFRVGLPLAKRRLVIGKYHRFATPLKGLTNHLSLLVRHSGSTELAEVLGAVKLLLYFLPSPLPRQSQGPTRIWRSRRGDSYTSKCV